MQWDIFHVMDGENMKVQIRILQRGGDEVPGQQLMEKILRACPELSVLRTSKETYDPGADVGKRWMFRLLSMVPANFYTHQVLQSGDFLAWEKKVEEFLISQGHTVRGWHTIEGSEQKPSRRGVYIDDHLMFYY